jgi:hypothetical protein
MVIIYDKNDLIEGSKNKHIKELNLSDIRFSTQPSQIAHVVIYVDREQSLLRVLKHKYSTSFDPRGVFSTSDLFEIINDGIHTVADLGKSILLPGRKEKRN